MPSMRGILMSRMARSGGDGLEAVERGGAVGIGHDPIALGLERDGDRGQDVAVVVDQRDREDECRRCPTSPSPLGTILCGAVIPGTAIAAASAPQHAVKRTAIAPGNTCHRSAIDVPSCGVSWGLFKPRVAVPGKTYFSAHYEAVERAMGRRLDLVKNYVDWGPGDTFPAIPDRRLARGHRMLYFSWNPINYTTHKRFPTPRSRPATGTTR